jgi:DNA polymerase-4
MLESDPPKYHAVYEKLIKIMKDYSPKIKMKSIDEGIIDFHGTEPVLKGRSLEEIGYEIKQRVRDEIGEWMRINIGIGPNVFLAKQAASWHKPDGLDTISYKNLKEYYSQIDLLDISGIAEHYAARLNAHNIFTPLDFLGASEFVLKKQVFRSIVGTYWYRRLRGYEVDDYETSLGMVGRQWVVHNPTHKNEYLLPCLSYLCETTGMKLRYREVEARGMCVWIRLKSGESWQGKRMYRSTFYTNDEIYKRAMEQFNNRPGGTVVMMGIYCYGLVASQRSQLGLFEDVIKKDWLTKAIDEINNHYGTFTIYSATTLNGTKIVKQKIPFGGTEYFELLLKRA